MDKHDRIQQLHQILQSRHYAVPTSELMAEMECGERTVRRHVHNLNDYHQTNYVFSRKYKGWVNDQADDTRVELPGLWFTGDQLQSLALLLHLIKELGQGVMHTELTVIKDQIHQQLKARGVDAKALEQNIHYLPLGNRQLNHKPFTVISHALLKQQRLHIEYINFQRGASQRDISPQSLVYYRENWYVDAWCHLRGDLRTFSVARVESVELLDSRAKRVSTKRIKQHFASGYGIFAGEPKQTAVLRFLPAIAHEIAQQQWHPDQQGDWQGEAYVLRLPYADARELVQDLLRWTPHVIVESPSLLREQLLERLSAGLAAHRKK